MGWHTGISVLATRDQTACVGQSCTGTVCNKNVIIRLGVVVLFADYGEKFPAESLFSIDVNSGAYYSHLIH